MDTKLEMDENDSESISNAHRELAIEAMELFNECNYAGSLAKLNKLQEHRPLDTRIAHNAAIVSFYESGFKNIDEFQKRLNSICSQVNYLSHRYKCLEILSNFQIPIFLGRN